MSSQDEGLFVSRRMVYIMIVVSLCVNVFFLLMGVLIGKDDLKWPLIGEENTAAAASTESGKQTLEEDLSLFDNSTNAERPAPIPAEYLDKKAPVPTQAPPITTTSDATLQNADSGMSVEDAAEPVPTTTEETKPEPIVATEMPVQTPEAAATPSEPSAEKTTPEKGSFWIQVTAISDATKALAYRDTMRKKGFRAVLVSEGTYHKVRVGPYQDRGSANADITKISQTLSVQGFIVQQ